MENRDDLYLKILWGAFVVSLFLPGLSADGDTAYGIQILLMGWLGVGVPSWYANPFLLFALRSIKNKKFASATSYSLIAVFLGFYAIYIQLFGNNCMEYLSTFDYKHTNGCIHILEGNYTLSIGYYLWLIVLVYTLLLSIVNLNKKENITRG